MRTPLYDCHLAAGARIVDFAGWEMPVQYTGVGEEHLAVRSAAGMFDVSHMGQVEVSGPDAQRLLQSLLSNDVERLKVGGAQYSVICNEQGGVLDDVFAYGLEGDRYLVVTNASNHRRDFEWISAHLDGLNVQLQDRASDYAMLAIQGPQARSLVGELASAELPERMGTAQLKIANVPVFVMGTGYTGEDGVELLCEPPQVASIWDVLLEAGVTPCGLAARDTLRIEACYHLYGNDLSEDRDPISAGLGWCCKEETGFIGADTIRAVRETGPQLTLAPFVFKGPGVPRAGNAVVGGGEVSSGTFSPSLKVGIGMAYLPTSHSQPGSEFQVDVRGKTREAVVVQKPIYSSQSGTVADVIAAVSGTVV